MSSIPGIFLGTTSACAENTTGDTSDCSNNRNYLRVRGEYASSTCMMSMMVELPPRARRIHGVQQAPVVVLGTTSACAENTPRQWLPQPRTRNYLRVRGEYSLPP